ncbi:MAG: DUF305 domain-containing protein [Mycobacterium sp.]
MNGTRKVVSGAAAIAAAILISACGGSDTAAAPSGAPSVSSSAAASNQGHNDADVTFAQAMIPHHEQAIEMSDMVLGKQGIDPRVTELANEIKAAQAPEIEQMTGWLTQWGVASTTSSAPSMPGHDMSGGDMSGGDMSGGDMPMADHGMMSDQDMAALQNAQGVAASTLFLQQMITHHEGAITMAQAEIDGGQFPAAVQLGREILSAQQEEITTMQGILDTL